MIIRLPTSTLEYQGNKAKIDFGGNVLFGRFAFEDSPEAGEGMDRSA
jgi:hypothetical protein